MEHNGTATDNMIELDLPAGSIVHIGGIPVYVAKATTVLAAKGNIPLMDVPPAPVLAG